MQKEEALNKLNETVEWLYQNKEKAAMQEVAELLPFFYNLAEKLMEKETEYVGLQIINMIKTLMENYQHFDMLGMADCLQNEAYDLIRAYASE